MSQYTISGFRVFRFWGLLQSFDSERKNCLTRFFQPSSRSTQERKRGSDPAKSNHVLQRTRLGSCCRGHGDSFPFSPCERAASGESLKTTLGLQIMRVDPLSWWKKEFGNVAPVGFVLRQHLQAHWVRFHSLPESKRYPESVSEYAELILRHTHR